MTPSHHDPNIRLYRNKVTEIPETKYPAVEIFEKIRKRIYILIRILHVV